jgi:hypothetical protein
VAQASALEDVRFGSKADMCSAKGHVRFTPEKADSRAATMSEGSQYIPPVGDITEIIGHFP